MKPSLANFTALSQILEVKPEDYLVVVTRGHRCDADVERFALRTPASYIGVGAQQYNQTFTFLTKISYKWLFKGSTLHSVRDSYTEKLLKNIGIDNVINTGCPTMWSLTPTLCTLIPSKKAKEAVLTLTDYKPNPERDNTY